MTNELKLFGATLRNSYLTMPGVETSRMNAYGSSPAVSPTNVVHAGSVSFIHTRAQKASPVLLNHIVKFRNSPAPTDDCEATLTTTMSRTSVVALSSEPGNS